MGPLLFGHRVGWTNRYISGFIWTLSVFGWSNRMVNG